MQLYILIKIKLFMKSIEQCKIKIGYKIIRKTPLFLPKKEFPTFAKN